jgi:hypothetical protein
MIGHESGFGGFGSNFDEAGIFHDLLDERIVLFESDARFRRSKAPVVGQLAPARHLPKTPPPAVWPVDGKSPWAVPLFGRDSTG